MMLEGRISVYRPRGGGQDYIEIEMVDKSSGTHFLKVQVGFEGFTRAITGQGHIPCRFLLRPAHVGEVYEHKVVEVFVPDGDFTDRETIARHAVLVHEKDGWAGRVGDALNHHNFAGRVEGGARYRVTFVRYVKGEGKNE